MTNEDIFQQTQMLKNYVVDCRRTVHRYAEVSTIEMKTSAFIQSQIEKVGLPFEKVGKTGLLAVLTTGRPGPCIALRADIDALPLPENPNNLTGPRVCVSENPSTCHACGHDAHTAMLLGSMRALAACRDSLCGTVYFCFEAGEENGAGVNDMLEALAKYQVDTVWAIHVYAALESGKICVDPGPRMAGGAGVELRFIGKGGHGSRPDLSINPVFCVANFLNNLAVAFANQIDANETLTLGITSIQGGCVSNIIPDTADVLGSLRFFNVGVGQKGVDIVKEVAEHTAAMHRCRVELTERTKIVVTPVITDPGCSSLAKNALPEVLPEGAITPCGKWFASESISRYLERYPGVFAFLGINNPNYGSGAEHHNEYFDVDENVLPLGMRATLKYVTAFMEKA
jgi:amidohydrolase